MGINADSIRRNRVRELILEALAPGHPNSLDLIVVQRHLSNFGQPVEMTALISYVAYLEEKGLVVTEKKGAGIIIVRITAKGLDVLDHRIDEIGIGET